MHEGERRFDPLVLQIAVEHPQLRGGQHSLVDDGAAGERREVHGLFERQLTLGPLARDEHLPVEGDAAGRFGGVVDEELVDRRLHLAGGLAQVLGPHRNGAPAQGRQPLLGHDRLDRRHRCGSRRRVGRQERQPHRVRAGGRQFELDDVSQEAVGHLDQDARTVAGVGFGAGGAAMFHVAERADGHRHQCSAALARDVGHERHATGVVFEPRVIEPLGGGQLRVHGSSFTTESRPAGWTGRHWPE